MNTKLQTIFGIIKAWVTAISRVCLLHSNNKNLRALSWRVKIFSGLTISIIVTTILFSSISNAQLVVADPAALAKLVDTINQGQQMILNMEKQIALAEKTADNFKGNLKRSAALINSLNTYKNILAEVRRTLPDIEPENLPAGRAPDMSQPKDVNDAIDYIYNPYHARGDLSRNMQQSHKQATTRSALATAELSIANTDKRFRELAELTAEIDGTQSLKDAADMANKLLLKILMAVEELTNLQAQLVRMEAAKNYKGLRAKKLKPKTLTAGEKLELEITNGGQMFKNNKCDRGLKEAGLCN